MAREAQAALLLLTIGLLGARAEVHSAKARAAALQTDQGAAAANFVGWTGAANATDSPLTTLFMKHPVASTMALAWKTAAFFKLIEQARRPPSPSLSPSPSPPPSPDVCGTGQSCKTSGCQCPSATPFCAEDGQCIPTRTVPSITFTVTFSGWTVATFLEPQRLQFVEDTRRAIAASSGLPQEIIRVLIQSVEPAAAGRRRLNADGVAITSTSSIDYRENPAVGAAALETFSTGTLQDPAQAATVWDTNGGSVSVENITPVESESVPEPPAICAPGAGECRDRSAQGGGAPTCSCPQTSADFRPNCLEVDSPPAPWAPSAPAGTCVSLCGGLAQAVENCNTNCFCPSSSSVCKADGSCAAPTVPGRPTITVVDNSATLELLVDVQPPSSDGGRAILDYKVVGLPADNPVGDTTTGRVEITATGEVQGSGVRRFTLPSTYIRSKAYLFTATARNEQGSSQPSDPAFQYTTCAGVANCQSYTSGCACDTCNANYDKCSAQLCTDLQSDVNNCGACDSPCAAGNSCQGGTCMCDATGTCTVTSILPQVNYQAPPYPYRQWFVRSLGEGSSITIADLATEAGLDDNTALAVNPPGGITHAVKLVSKTPDTVTYGFAEPYVMWPPESLSGTFPRPTPAPAGMFNGVLAKTMLLSSTNRFRYDFFKSGGPAAIALRIRLYSPSLNKQANIIWEPAYNAAYKVVPLKTWVNVQFGKEGVVWVCGNAGAFSELGGSGYGTCDTKYKSIEYFLTTSDAGSNYKDTQFFGDAVVLGVSLMQANPGLVSFWNNLEVEYEGEALKWVFSG